MKSCAFQYFLTHFFLFLFKLHGVQETTSTAGIYPTKQKSPLKSMPMTMRDCGILFCKLQSPPENE
jgi:hypothetical protein